ncbi:Lrp/AsnC family transcriptional regulator [Sneathiella sp. CAU 1612]|uniref:Lrp/AsnC family transcriptional regulator n=1 Tax=Sneathiella sedimenti TaxID=2816034 RepID=A0ABS3F606_9PROT|nr:Lrp/AsnC family transcriptional regulator [Sneathiella sedimenti]MBO0333913.1 Lrp/AsnC family transcriptional regulator [Sneathiella sedimenti]
MIKLDDRDLKILAVLQQDGRIPKNQLAERVHLSPTACWERLKRLEDAGVIEGYGARLSFAKLGSPAIIFMQVELASHRAEDFERFEKAVSAIDEITECWAVGGGIDYFLKLVCKGVDAYQRKVDEMLAADIGLRRYYTYVVTKAVKKTDQIPASAIL